MPMLTTPLRSFFLLIAVFSVVIAPGIAADLPSLAELKKRDLRGLTAEQAAVFEAASSKGDSEATWILCNYYLYHHDPRGRRYLSLAADQGSPEAQCSMYAYEIQSPDPKVRENAVRWLHKAAKQGCASAIYDLEHHEEYLKLENQRHAKAK